MSKEDIDKLDKQIELLKNENNKKVVEKVTTEIKDEEDPNHVINIDYIDSEVNEATKEKVDIVKNELGIDVSHLINTQHE